MFIVIPAKAGIQTVSCARKPGLDPRFCGGDDFRIVKSVLSAARAHAEAVIRSGRARLTVLTSALIRMEWARDGRFEDRPSEAICNRRLEVPRFKVIRHGKNLTIETDDLTIRYNDNGKKFSRKNLSIEFSLNGSSRVWRPGDKPAGNLGGPIRTLDGVNGAAPLGPGVVSRDGWSVVDDSGKPVFEGNPPWPVARQSDRVDLYFFGHGHDYPRAIRDFTAVSGRIPLPPRYIFGSWWSRYWAYTDRELKRLVGEFKAHGVPLDVLVIDMDWHLDGWTGYTWNPKYFPEPAKFLKWVRDRGIRVTLNLHPADGVGAHESKFPEMARAMGIDPARTKKIPFDSTDRRFVNAYFKYLHHPLERQGVDFWWMDWQQSRRTKIKGLDPLIRLNRLHWKDMSRRAARTERRPVIFSRWGGFGNHRYPIGFSGDTHSTWESLAFQPGFTAASGNAGYAYWSHDIGGHMPGPVEPELYARWIQWGALSPVLRTHSSKNPAAERRIWAFPKKIFDAARKAFHLRNELLPYIYSAARRCTDDATPLCRPLYHAWPNFDESYAFQNEYLFGEDFLAAPVTTPAPTVGGTAATTVWIPPGEWIDWFTGRRWIGPRVIERRSPLDEMPLYVRSGAVIPAAGRSARARDAAIDPLILHIFPGDDGETRVYEDDGVSDRYLRGEFSWTPVRQYRRGDMITVEIGPTAGTWRGQHKRRRIELRFRCVGQLPKVHVNGRPQRLRKTDSAETCAILRISDWDIRKRLTISSEIREFGYIRWRPQK